MKNIPRELKGAPAIPFILSILQNGDSYGYEIAQKLKKLTKIEIARNEAIIYPVLRMLESERMIKSYWRKEGNRFRRYYRIRST
jgi:DNA-binding PadR family transcriptional regulator